MEDITLGILDSGTGGLSSLEQDSQRAQMKPRGGATSPCFRLNLRRVWIAASAYTGPNSERPLFCSQWKSVMGRPQKRDPFVPHSVHMCARGGGVGGVGGCIFGSDSEVLTVKHSSKPGPLPSSGNACVPTTAVWITQPHTHAYLSFMKYGGKKKTCNEISPVSFLGKPAK